MVTGDLIQDDSAAAYEHFRQLLGGLGMPVYCVPGNHDVRDLMHDALSEPPFVYCGIRRVDDWLSSASTAASANRRAAAIADAEFDRVDAAIAASDASHVMLDLHHPPVALGSKWLDSVGMDNGAEALRRFAASGKVRLAIFGHVHQDFTTEYAGISIIATPSTCSQFAAGSAEFAIDDNPPAYRRIELASGRLTSQRINLGRKSCMSLFSEAQQVIAGGVNSPVRAFAGVGGEPVFFASAQGAWLEGEDGKRYIDYVASWGPMILGHGHPAVIDAVVSTAQRGLSFGAPCTLETRLAEKIRALVPSMQKLRMVSSGTEATMSAIRLARGHTGRDKIIKFEGCYHGHSDSLLIKAGSGALTLGVPSSPGVPAGLAEHTVTLAYNDSDAVRRLSRSWAIRSPVSSSNRSPAT